MDPTIVQGHFNVADKDRDGFVSGQEGVAFFQQSGLPTPVLRQIWEMASGNKPKLDKGQFTNALRLVSLAQSLNGQLDLPKARVVMAGMGSPTPPDMSGVWRPKAPGAAGPPAPGAPPGAAVPPGFRPPAPGGMPMPGAPPKMGGPHGAPGVGGVPPNAAFRPPAPGTMGPQRAPSGGPIPPAQMQRAPSGGAPNYAPQFTGTGYVPQSTGAGGLPPAQPVDLQRYEAAFLQLDKDKDGLVQGRDCFGFFMQWNLDKAVLKHIWDLVAGNKGTLNKQQLAGCLYLMDNAKKGIKPPPRLPPGPFPPVASSWNPQTQFSQAKLGATPYQPPPLPQMPQLPAKYVEPATSSPPPEKPSQAPKMSESTAALLSESERAKVTMAQREAAEKEAKLHSAEGQASSAKNRLHAYNAALQEVTVFKSRTDIALLQGQDEANRLEEELAECKKKYEQSYYYAQSQGRASAKLRERLAEIIEHRTEAEKKLMSITEEIAAASRLTPEDVQRMESEVALLAQQVAAAEQARNAYSLRLTTIREQRTVLEGKLKELKEAAAAAAKEEESARAEVLALSHEAQQARSNKGGKGGIGKTAELLSKAANAYRALYSTVGRAGGEVPFDARPTNLGLAMWFEDALAGAADFADNMGASEAAHGYVLVNALPGQVMPKPGPPKGEAPPGQQQQPGQQPQQQQQPGQQKPAPLPADAFAEGFGDDDAFVMVGNNENENGKSNGAAAQGAEKQGEQEQATGKKKKDKKDKKAKEAPPAAEARGQAQEAAPPQQAAQSATSGDLLGDDNNESGQAAGQEGLPAAASQHSKDSTFDSTQFSSVGAGPEDEEASPPPKTKKKGKGLDALFDDDMPSFPPPNQPQPPQPLQSAGPSADSASAPASQPSFPAFQAPPTGGASSTESEHGEHSSEGEPDEPAAAPQPAAGLPPRPPAKHDSSDDESAAEPPAPQPGTSKSKSESTDFRRLSAGSSDMGKAGYPAGSDSGAHAEPQSHENPTYSLQGPQGPGQSAVVNPAFSESGGMSVDVSEHAPSEPDNEPHQQETPPSAFAAKPVQEGSGSTAAAGAGGEQGEGGAGAAANGGGGNGGATGTADLLDAEEVGGATAPAAAPAGGAPAPAGGNDDSLL